MHKRIPVLLIVAATPLAGCRDIRADANMAEAMNQLGVEITSMQQDYSILQEQVDSLRSVVARQDTIITRLANIANVQLPQR